MVRMFLGALFGVLFAVSTAFAGDGFPTSVNPPKSEWTRMGSAPYTGTLLEACSLLKLSQEECGTYLILLQEGSCARLEVPNGTVLDEVLFTSHGVGKSLSNARVALKNPKTRWADVCQISSTLYAGRFDGCHNPFKVVAAAPVILPPAKPHTPYRGEGAGLITCPDGQCNICK